MKNAQLHSQLYACGRDGLPEKVTLKGDSYRLSRVLKHDFFAATGLYEHCPDGRKTAEKVVLKLARQQHFLGLPFGWLGGMLSGHEQSILARLKGLSAVPQPLGTYDHTGFIYKYVRGKPLSHVEKLPDDFFDKLLEAIRQMHARGVVYLDMNKRDNIILGEDGQPHLIDFQISLHLDKNWLIFKSVSDSARQLLESADLYHLCKHRRKLRPDLPRSQEPHVPEFIPTFIKVHRFIATPIRKLRRAFLKRLTTRKFPSAKRSLTHGD